LLDATFDRTVARDPPAERGSNGFELTLVEPGDVVGNRSTLARSPHFPAHASMRRRGAR
jgi:hypothetical protein